MRAARPGVHRLHGRPRTCAARRPTCSAWSCSAPTRRPGRCRRADAEGGRLGGDPRLGHERRLDALRHRLGGRPGSVPGDRPRPAAPDRRRGARAAARAGRPAAGARRSPASAAARTRSGCSPAFVDDPGVAARGRRGGGGGHRDRPPRRAADRRRAPGRAARRAERAAAGRGGPDPRGPLDLGGPGLPGLRSRARLAARLRPRDATSRCPTPRRWPRSARSTRLEGIIPALETAHALHYALHVPSESRLDLLCLSGRGDKDLAEVLARYGNDGRRRRTGAGADRGRVRELAASARR